MKQPPYSYSEAQMLCEEYHFLKGLAYNKDTDATVNAVLVAPFDSVSKNRFVMLYLMLNDAKEILAKDYSGAQYDVIVVSGSLAENNFQHQDLCGWFSANEQQGMMLDMPSEANNSFLGA